jgi:putative phage-type endonuclease
MNQIVKTKHGYQLITDSTNCLQYTKNRKQWQEARRNFIGGSDAAAIANIIPNSKEKYGVSLWTNYASPLTLYLDKVEGKEKAYTAAMARGHRREAGIRKVAAREIMAKEGLNKGVKVYVSHYTYQSREHPFMGANLDGLVVHPEYGVCGLEIKTANEWAGADWQNDGLPFAYYCQIQHYMYVTGLSRFYLVAEIGDYLHTRTILRNEQFIADLIAAESAFFNQMQEGIKPQPIGLKCENESIKVEQKTGEYLSSYLLADDLIDTLAKLEDLKNQKKELEQAIEAIEQQFKIAIGENEGITVGNKAISYKEHYRESVDTSRLKAEHFDIYSSLLKKSGYRRLVFKERKELVSE